MYEDLPKVDTDFAHIERDFLRKLALLPDEIAKRWREEYENLPEMTTEFFARFNQFCTLRDQAMDGSLELDENISDEIRLEIEGVKKVVRETFGDPQHFLGNGYTAEVYELPIAPHLCVKYIHDQEAYNQNNHIRVEHDFLAELRNFSVEGVRSPLPYFIRIHPSEGHSYGMERIQGKSLSQILERPADNLELITMLKMLDGEAVKKSLLSYVTALHDTFKITHGDLFQRNIMVDGQGNFFVIDFGKAKREEIGEDHEGRRKTDIATLTSEIGVFFNARYLINSL
jgi:tRNA A-37 threonylcarbamoyl transferase component Bud32